MKMHLTPNSLRLDSFGVCVASLFKKVFFYKNELRQK